MSMGARETRGTAKVADKGKHVELLCLPLRADLHMASSAPVDIWIKIFEEIIDVPEFFCPDPLTTFGVYSWSKFRHEGYYWRAERWRNRLRRVSRSWNALANSPVYRHRFVRISDIAHGHFTKEEVPWDMTLRITFSPEQGCACEDYCRLWNGTWDGAKVISRSLEMMNRIVARYRHKGDKFKMWRLRMVDGVLKTPDQPDILETLTGIANLTTIRAHTGWDQLAPHSNLLQLLDIEFSTHFQPGVTASPPSLALFFPRLTTLIINTGNQSFPISKLRISTLQHLQIRGNHRNGSQAVLDELISIVEAVGSNLRTLYYDYVYLTGRIPQRFWELVPNLLQIRLNCLWTHPPPRDHPVKTIQIQGILLQNELPGRTIPSYPSFFRSMPGWPLWSASTLALIGSENVSKATEWSGRCMHVRMTDIWERAFFKSSYLARCLFVAEEYDNLGWTFTDYTGLKFSEFLVYCLERRRVAKKMGRRDWIPSGYLYAASGQIAGASIVQRARTEEEDRDILEAEMADFEDF